MQNLHYPPVQFLGSTSDKIGKLETIVKDFREISVIIGTNGKLRHLNKTKKTDYRLYYDSQTIEIVREWFSEDIKLFGYEYED